MGLDPKSSTWDVLLGDFSCVLAMGGSFKPGTLGLKTREKKSQGQKHFPGIYMD